MARTAVRVRGMDCAEGVNALRSELTRLLGVEELDLNLLQERMTHDLSSLAVCDSSAMADHPADTWRRRSRHIRLHPPADRRRARHHQQAGTDQHRGDRPLAHRDRETDHVPY